MLLTKYHDPFSPLGCFFSFKVVEECELQRPCCLGVHQELRVPCTELILVPVCSAPGVDLTSTAVNLELITNVLSKSIAPSPPPSCNVIHPTGFLKGIFDNDTSISVAFYQTAPLKRSRIKHAALLVFHFSPSMR